MGQPARHLVVLAGGDGSRVGGQKAMRQLHGRPLIDYVLDAGRVADLELVVAVKRSTQLPPELEARGVRVVVEPDTPVHPLNGVCNALAELGAPVVVCACDMPFVSGELLGELARETDAAVRAPRVDGFLQPTLAYYSPAALGLLQDAVDGGKSSLWALEQAQAEVIEESELARFGEPARLVADLDTAEQLAAEHQSSSSSAN